MPNAAAQQLTIFLVFKDNAEEAMNFYTSLFEDAEVTRVIRAEAQDAGWIEGTLQHAIFSIAGMQFMCINTPPSGNRLHGIAPWQDFRFNPAMTIYVQRDTKEQFDKLYEALSEKGDIYLPAESYGFSPQYAWVVDRFGMSWRINQNTPT